MLLLEKIYSTMWLASPETLRQIEEVALMHKEIKYTRDDFKVLAGLLGTPIGGSKKMELRGQTAVIPVHGPIVSRADALSEVSGVTSAAGIAKSFNEAIENTDVKSIVMDFSSGGGQAELINEVANMIFAGRSIKPVHAYVSGSAHSAAYWLATATESITMDEIASVGSVGVAIYTKDATKAQERIGIKPVSFHSKKAPNKILDIKTSKGKEQLQDHIDSIESVFLSSVAKFRTTDQNKFTADRIAKEFKGGGVAMAAEAVELGMADRIGSLEGLLLELNEEHTMNTNENPNPDLKSGETTPILEAAAEELAVSLASDLPEVQEVSIDAAASLITSEVITPEAYQEILTQLADSTRKAAELAASNLAMQSVLDTNSKDLVLATAQNLATTLGSKLATSQKTSFIELYTSLTGNDTAQAALVQFVEASPSFAVLEEEILEDTALNVLPTEPVSLDEFAEIDKKSREFVNKHNKQKKGE